MYAWVLHRESTAFGIAGCIGATNLALPSSVAQALFYILGSDISNLALQRIRFQVFDSNRIRAMIVCS